MAAALILPVSGPYTGTLDSNDMGIMDDNGYRIGVTFKGEEVNRTDAYAQTLLEGIYQGQDWSLQLTAKEALSTWYPLIFFQLEGATSMQPVLNGWAGTRTRTIGDRFSYFGMALVLNAVLLGTPTSPISLTALTAVMSPGSQTQMQFTSKVRDVPMQFSFLPYTATITLPVSGSKTVQVPFTVA